MLSVPEFGRRTYFTLLAALTATGACAWVVALLVLRPHEDLALAWAMMTLAALLPSSAPMVATFTSLRHAAGGGRRASAGAVAFVAGYLATWWAAGMVADIFSRAPDTVAADRWIDATVLVLASAYELTPLKRRCLAACRVPLSFVLSTWRDGVGGAADMGVRYGLQCVGACVALVLALFAVEPGEITGLAAVAGVVAAQKLLPGRTVVIRVTAFALFAAAIAVVVAGTPG